MKKQKKLDLNRQTIRQLTDTRLSAALGGLEAATPDRCTRAYTGCNGHNETEMACSIVGCY